MHRLIACSLLYAGVAALMAAEPEATPYKAAVKPASNEGVKAMARFRKPKGVEVRLWAAEPLLANPVSFCFDEKGRCFVAETFRLSQGVTDNRSNMYWLDDDLASRTVADRVAMYRKHQKRPFASYERHHDRVRLIVDTTGKGVADKATVYADGFHHAADGLGAGVLARKGSLYYTCIPDLYLFKGHDKADERKSLATGFGVHVAFIGHDMHGLRMGPDGRLYFSIGDRGFNVTTKEGRHLYNPDSGAVLRCEPDGSNLEIVHRGLRNPQELAFDQYGNLFTVDNNSDSVDKARLVQIVEGGDSGWRTGYQYGSGLSDRGPFNAEKIWHLPCADQPAYIVPPLAHICSGPAGFCFNYGATALPERYKDHFFICDFRGSPGGSSIYSFAVKPKGASFEPIDGHQAFGGVLATDCDFGPDGGFYVSDWVSGWNLTGKGRIYRFADPVAEKNPLLAETKKLLAEGFDKRSNEELAKLLEHPDMRVRQEAQFTLAAKGKEAIGTLTRIVFQSKNQVARIHAIWGLGQIGRSGDREDVCVKLVQAVGSDPEINAQIVKTMGDMQIQTNWVETFEPLLHADEPRVRLLTALMLGRPILPAPSTWNPRDVYTKTNNSVLAMLRENADKDPYLRHAGVMAIANLARAFRDGKIEADPSEGVPVRLAIALAQRRLGSPAIADFLTDPDPRIALEAARAIHDDEGIAAALPKLAAMLDKSNQPEFLLWRALNANFRLGKPENASLVAAFAAMSRTPEKLRVEAIKMLGEWTKPGRRDRITGLTQNLGTRDAAIGSNAFRTHLGSIFTGPDAVRKEATSVAAKLGIKEVAPVLFDLVADVKQTPATRVEAIRALAALKDARLDKAMRLALDDGDVLVCTEGRRQLAKVNPDEAISILTRALATSSPKLVVELQGVYSILGEMKSDAADALLAKSLAHLLKDELPPAVHLDLLDAAAKRQTKSVKDALAAYESARPKGDDLAQWRETLFGGNAERGRAIFYKKLELSCVRCHRINGQGGEVGPELTGIGTKQKRDYLLESIVLPNKQIAKGFESVVLQLTNGKSVNGIIKAEDDKTIRLMTPEGKLLTVPKNTVDERQKGKSAMPEDLVKHLTKAELRDLVEFLASLKEPAKEK